VLRALLAVKLNANRNVTGNLRGFDQFMNIVLDNTVEEVSETERNDMGLVVRAQHRAWDFLSG
jgi:small nuclear ribonucleoprotein G